MWLCCANGFVRVKAVLKVFLTSERALAVLRVAPFTYLLGLIFTNVRKLRSDPEHGLLQVSDFFCFWAAAKAAIFVDSALVYDNQAFRQFGGSYFENEGFLHFFYPPTLLMLYMPLGYLPNIAAFIVFIGVTLAGYALMARYAYGGWIGGLYVIALPTTLFAIYFGQNSLLLCALLGGALVALRNGKLVLSGILIGCLTIKPQIGVLIPFALLAGRHWSAFAAATLTTVFLVLASWLMFGSETWVAFFGQTIFAKEILDHEYLPYVVHVTPFSTLQQIGVPYSVAIALQIALVGVMIMLTVRVWQKDVPFDLKAAVLSSAALLSTPYLLSYDLALLSVPFIFLLHFAKRNAFSKREKWAIAAAMTIGSVAEILNYNLGIPVGPLAPAILLGLAWRRVFVLSAQTARDDLLEYARP